MKEDKRNLPQKYRPETFDDIVGAENQKTVATIKNMMERGKKFAFLFHGPKGCGKTSICRVIAKTYLKKTQNHYQESDVLHSRFGEGDPYIEYNASHYGVKNIREIIDSTQNAGWCGTFIRFFDEAHLLGDPAQEASLKWLEDLDLYDNIQYLIFATTKPDKIIDTFRDRCQVFEIFKCTDAEIEEFVRKISEKEGLNVPPEVIAEIVQAAAGSPRLALEGLDSKASRLNLWLPEIPKQELQSEEKPAAPETAPEQVEEIKDLAKKKQEEEKALAKQEEEKALAKKKQEEEERLAAEALAKQEEWFYRTYHLKNFDLLARATGLLGPYRKLINKAIWYILHGEIMKLSVAEWGTVIADGRFHFMFIAPSGGGKLPIRELLKTVCRGLGGEAEAITTISNVQQLVGTTVKGEHQPGLMDYDMLIFDDAVKLVKSQSGVYPECRTMVIMGADPYRKNEVYKKLTREDGMRYFPKCTFQILVQPVAIPSSDFQTGFLRRFLCVYIPIAPEFDYAQRTKKRNVADTNNLIEYLKQLKKNSKCKEGVETVELPEPVEARFHQLHRVLLDFGKGYSEAINSIINNLAPSMQDMFFKMLRIFVNSTGRAFSSTEIDDVDVVFADFLEFLNSTFAYIDQKVDGSLGYGDELSYSDYRMLKWLKEQNAVSLETSKIVIHEGKIGGCKADSYHEKIIEVFNLRAVRINTDEKARKIYRKHIFKRWIDSKQVGKLESRVWITKAGMELVADGMFYEDREKRIAVLKEYRKLRLAKSERNVR